MNKNKQILNLISIVIFSAILIVACSKARIEGPIDAGSVEEAGNNGDNKLHFTELNNYFSSKQHIKLETVESLLPSANYHPTSYGLVLLHATTANSNGTPSNYPIYMSVLHLENIKDFILHNKKTTFNNQFLEDYFMFNIKLTNSQNELLHLTQYGQPASNYLIQLKHLNLPPIEYSTYQLNYTNNNWNNTNFNTQVYSSNLVNIYLSDTGWFALFNYAQFNTSEFTNINFISNNADLTNVGIYICYSDINSYTKVENLTSIAIPVGENAKILAIGITKEGQLYYNYKEIIIENNTSDYNIEMHQTTDQILTQILDSL